MGLGLRLMALGSRVQNRMEMLGDGVWGGGGQDVSFEIQVWLPVFLWFWGVPTWTALWRWLQKLAWDLRLYESAL